MEQLFGTTIITNLHCLFVAVCKRKILGTFPYSLIKAHNIIISYTAKSAAKSSLLFSSCYYLHDHRSCHFGVVSRHTERVESVTIAKE